MNKQLPLFDSSPEDDQTPKSISEITRHIRYLLDTDNALQDIWVEGEVSNFKRAASGHLYFSLKDSRAQLKCVMWKSDAERISFTPAHGDQLLAHGRVSVYEPQGAYQLYVDTLQPAGVGDLNRQFELLKAKLEAEGLFDPARKHPLPFFPRRMGIVTSPDAAGYQDVLNILRRRFPFVEVILSPTQVQGDTAPPKIIAAIERLHQRTDIDVILIVRGGGSLEDLWCFNDEQVVRTVAAATIPIVTGVGHEIDFTLVDFAADMRAPTPSAAAEVATPNKDDLLETLDSRRDQLSGLIDAYLGEYGEALKSRQHMLQVLNPLRELNTLRQKLDDQSARLAYAIRSQTQTEYQRLEVLTNRLHNASPQSLLERGYAIVTRADDGGRINSVKEAAPGANIRVQLRDGTLSAQVKEKNDE